MIGDRKYWGKGLATDALRAVCDYAFTILGTRKLTAGVVAENAPIIKAFRRVGFLEEGRLRSKLLILGNYHEHVLFGCLKDEFVSDIN